MEIFDHIIEHDHEQVVLCSDKESGLKAIIAIHDTTLGPALGGTRMWTYASNADAVNDALRLSRGMTYKAAVAGLNLGGGKAVIIGNPHEDKSEALFRAYGRYVEGVGGRYITAEDVGTSVRDMEWVRMETEFVTGVGGKGGSGDPSPFTAYGTYCGIKAAAKYQRGNDSLKDVKIALQGAGHVAWYLAEYLHKEGAKLFVSDIYEDKAKQIVAATGAEFVAPEEIYDVDCDVFSPAALGGIINDATIDRLKCSIVAGAANNQLAEEEKHGEMLRKKGILYAPDYVINAGGLMNVASEIDGYDEEKTHRKAEGIYETLLTIFERAAADETATYIASDRIAEERIENIKRLNSIHVGAPRIKRG